MYWESWRRVCLQPDPSRPSVEPYLPLLSAVVVVGAFGRVWTRRGGSKRVGDASSVCALNDYLVEKKPG
jgi:hypothetical protein